ncbi:hypothetical protein [Streptomyces sp. NPDC001450]
MWLTGGLLGVAALFAIGADAPCFAAGGFNAASALWASYESGLCVALCVGLLTLFRETLSRSHRLSAELAADSYGVCIVHLPLVVGAQYYLSGRGLSAVGAWRIVCVLVVPVAFLTTAGLRRVPGFRRVL